MCDFLKLFKGKNKKYVNRVKSRNSRDDMMTDDRTESLPYGADGERGVPTLVRIKTISYGSQALKLSILYPGRVTFFFFNNIK